MPCPYARCERTGGQGMPCPYDGAWAPLGFIGGPWARCPCYVWTMGKMPMPRWGIWGRGGGVLCGGRVLRVRVDAGNLFVCRGLWPLAGGGISERWELNKCLTGGGAIHRVIGRWRYARRMGTSVCECLSTILKESSDGNKGCN
jgi:hypothetical protein